MNVCCDRVQVCRTRVKVCHNRVKVRCCRVHVCCDCVTVCRSRVKVCWSRVHVCCFRVTLCGLSLPACRFDVTAHFMGVVEGEAALQQDSFCGPSRITRLQAARLSYTGDMKRLTIRAVALAALAIAVSGMG